MKDLFQPQKDLNSVTQSIQAIKHQDPDITQVTADAVMLNHIFEEIKKSAKQQELSQTQEHRLVDYEAEVRGMQGLTLELFETGKNSSEITSNYTATLSTLDSVCSKLIPEATLYCDQELSNTLLEISKRSHS